MERIRRYIRAGDVYQVNLARRITRTRPSSTAARVEALRRRYPAPFAARVGLGEGREILSNSPELFLRRRGDRVETHPIKGTFPAGPGARARLARSAKDRAELAMIVDLERNDLGRVCRTGSVRVETERRFLQLPTVVHSSAVVRGRLEPGTDTVDLLRAVFPGGSVTGAPKVRAMEIIEELEPVRRGPYCGAIGWIAPGGDLELSLAIRVALVDGGGLHVYAGGGIVADSEPAKEFRETEAKVRAFQDLLKAECPGRSGTGAGY